jgi:hypothetical protein
MVYGLGFRVEGSASFIFVSAAHLCLKAIVFVLVKCSSAGHTTNKQTNKQTNEYLRCRAYRVYGLWFMV